MRITLSVVAVVVVLLGLGGCASRVRARPGVGVGARMDADGLGSRAGLDFGTYDAETVVANPVTGDFPVSGNCVGDECGIPNPNARPAGGMAGAARALKTLGDRLATQIGEVEKRIDAKIDAATARARPRPFPWGVVGLCVAAACFVTWMGWTSITLWRMRRA